MRDENPIHTLGDYSRPIHEGYQNTIELPDGNNVVPLRSDTIRLVQNGCSFHRLRFEDPNQHLKDFLKLVDSLNLDDLLQKSPHHGIDLWFQIQIFYEHVSFHLKCEIDRGASGKLHDKNAEESWEIIENLVLYDYDGWDDPRDFVKLVKAISLPQNTPKTPDRRLLEFEDQISYLLKGSRTTPETSSTHVPQAYAKVISSNPRSQNFNGPPRMERFEKAIFKQREEINDRMAEMFGLLKELSTSRTPEKVFVREEARQPITRHVNTISLVKIKKEKSVKNNEVVDKNIVELSELDIVESIKLVDRKEEMKDGKDDESARSTKEELTG
ncbi:hypothetical protein Tco_0506008 [Tanacetum coccineum]